MILGHERQLQYLDKVIRRGRLAHAYLFYGPEHLGKLTVAKAVAKVLHCENAVHAADGHTPAGLFDTICGECFSCRAIERGSHSHVKLLDLEHTLISKKEARKDIPIEDIRELRRVLALMSEGERWRVVIINDAQRLSVPAADAILKLLEEPGQNILFFLITQDREFLSPTVVSRTQPIRFSAVSDSVLSGFLGVKRKDSLEKQEIIFFARGRPGIMIRMLEGRENLLRDKKLLSQVDTLLAEGDLPEAFHLNEKLAADAEGRTRVIELVISILREKLLALRSYRDIFLLIERIKKIDSIAVTLSTTNVNPRMAMDVLFLEAIGDR